MQTCDEIKEIEINWVYVIGFVILAGVLFTYLRSLLSRTVYEATEFEDPEQRRIKVKRI